MENRPIRLLLLVAAIALAPACALSSQTSYPNRMPRRAGAAPGS